jgi:hypothetical protein
MLEARDCPSAAVITDLEITGGNGQLVAIKGAVTDDHPSTVIVRFAGVVTGTTTVDSGGHFFFTALASGSGTVTAIAHDDQNLDSDPAFVNFNNVAPTISNFTAVHGAGNIWTFSGTVADESPGGLTVYFGGLTTLQNLSATVAADGSFSLTVELQPGESGLATCQTFDWWGVKSNTAEYIV